MPVHADTILCEAVRQELNNKVSLLGVFGQLIFIPQIPGGLTSLALFQRWLPSANEGPGTTFRFEFSIEGPDRAELLRVPPQQAVVQPGRSPQMLFVIQFQGFPMPSEGEYRIVTLIDGRPQHTHRFNVARPTDEERVRFGLTGF